MVSEDSDECCKQGLKTLKCLCKGPVRLAKSIMQISHLRRCKSSTHFKIVRMSEEYVCCKDTDLTRDF